MDLLAHDGLHSMRERALAIQGLDVRLDESRFCSHCSPGETRPAPGLVLRLKDGREIRTWNVSGDDLGLLELFVAPPASRPRGEDGYFTREEAERLATLLGEG